VCGLSGIFSNSLEQDAAIRVNESIDSLVHRGPDAVGYFSNENVKLGHCRLAFKGQNPNNPVSDSGKRFYLGLNGEIYNYKELAKEYGISKSIVDSAGDAGVVVELYKLLGEKSIGLLDGHFAFYIFDSLRNEIHLYRDRFGSKPLYYIRLGHEFIFCSEIKSLPLPRNYTPALNIDALSLYFRTQNFYGSETIFQSIFLVEPGQHVSLSQHGVQTEFFYLPTFSRDEEDTTESVLHEFERFFLDSVESQWEEGIQVSGYLSGGVDSSLIAICANKLGFSYDTYTTKFASSSHDESMTAKNTASRLEFENFSVELDESLFWNRVSGISRVVEEPRFGQCINNLMSMESISGRSKIVMSGIGADELFGGYPWRYSFADPQILTIPVLKNALISKQCRLSPFSEDLVSNVDRTYAEVKLNLIVDEVLAKHSEHNLDKRGLYAAMSLDLKYWLPSLLVVEDKLSMSLGIETRMPFLNNNLWKLGNTVSAKTIFRDFKGTVEGKVPLRLLLTKWGFDELSTRPKQGFSAPDNLWFSKSKHMEKIFKKSNPLWDILIRENFQRIYSEHNSGGLNHRGLLWSLIYMDDFITHW